MSIIPHHKYSNNNIFLESSDVCLNHRSVSNQSSGVRALYSFGTRVGKANCCSSGMAAEIPLIKTSRAADKERAARCLFSASRTPIIDSAQAASSSCVRLTLLLQKLAADESDTRRACGRKKHSFSLGAVHLHSGMGAQSINSRRTNEQVSFGRCNAPPPLDWCIGFALSDYLSWVVRRRAQILTLPHPSISICIRK
jgi:hypothetical protein